MSNNVFLNYKNKYCDNKLYIFIHKNQRWIPKYLQQFTYSSQPTKLIPYCDNEIQFQELNQSFSKL